MNWLNVSVFISALAALLSILVTAFSIWRYKLSRQKLQKEVNYLLDQASFIQRLASENPLEKPAAFESDYIDDIMRVSPSAAVVASLHNVEQALRDRGVASIRDAETKLSSDVAGLFRQFMQLRNEIVHAGKEEQVDANKAVLLAKLATQFAHVIRSI